MRNRSILRSLVLSAVLSAGLLGTLGACGSRDGSPDIASPTQSEVPPTSTSDQPSSSTSPSTTIPVVETSQPPTAPTTTLPPIAIPESLEPFIGHYECNSGQLDVGAGTFSITFTETGRSWLGTVQGTWAIQGPDGLVIHLADGTTQYGTFTAGLHTDRGSGVVSPQAVMSGFTAPEELREGSADRPFEITINKSKTGAGAYMTAPGMTWGCDFTPP